MQQPVRYYITKSGEEPTVRSVRVARGEEERDLHEPATGAPSEESSRPREVSKPRQRVKRLVAEAMRRHSAES